MKLIHGDCITEMRKLIEDNVKVDLILTDPPYGTIKGLGLWDKKETQWDNTLPTNTIFELSKKLLRINGRLILFSQEPYTSHLRTNTIHNFPMTYPLIWEKNHFANGYNSKKACVSYFEDMTLFSREHDDYKEHPLRKYSKYICEKIGKTEHQIRNEIGHSRLQHFLSYKGIQYHLCTEESYNILIEKYHINKLKHYKTYEELVEIDNKYKRTFNLKKGANSKSNIFKYHKPTTHYHPTEKPVPLLEDLIKTYTNKGDTVLDFTMGGGSTAVASFNTGREFIGIELNEKYYNTTYNRVKKLLKNM